MGLASRPRARPANGVVAACAEGRGSACPLRAELRQQGRRRRETVHPGPCGPALRGQGLGQLPLRLLATGLPRARGMVAKCDAAHPRHDAGKRRARRLHGAAGARRRLAVQRSLAQSRDHRAHLARRRRQSLARAAQSSAGRAERHADGAAAPRRPLHRRRGSRHHPRRGGVPQRADRADPIQADNGNGVRRAGADRARLDHEILRARSQPAQFAGPLSGRTRLQRIHDLLAQSHARGSGHHLRRLSHLGRHGGAERDQCDSARAQGACLRLLHRRHAARHRRRHHGPRQRPAPRHVSASSPRRPISARPAS